MPYDPRAKELCERHYAFAKSSAPGLEKSADLDSLFVGIYSLVLSLAWARQLSGFTRYGNIPALDRDCWDWQQPARLGKYSYVPIATIGVSDTSYPGLNVLINNAGVQYRRDFRDETAVTALDQEVAINFTAPIHLIAELLPALRRQESALIVNVTSGLAFSPMADVPVYCATKAALHSFTLSLRHQLKATSIRVVELAPPIVDTGLGGDTRSPLEK